MPKHFSSNDAVLDRPTPYTYEARFAHTCFARLQELASLFRAQGLTPVIAQRFDADWVHIHKAARWVADRLEDDYWAQMCIEFAKVGRALLRVHGVPHVQIEWAESAVVAAQRLGVAKVHADCMLRLALALYGIGNAHRAISCVQHSLELRGNACEVEEKIEALLRMGEGFAVVGQLRQAEKHLTEALQLARAHVLNDFIDTVLGVLIGVEADLGHLQRAERHLQEFLQREGSTESSEFRARRLRELGRMQMRRRDFAGAVATFTKALDLLSATGDIKQSPVLLGYLAGAHMALEQYAEALICLKEARRPDRRFGNRIAWNRLGILRAKCLMRLGKLRRAIRIARKHLKTALDRDDRYSVPEALLVLGESYENIGDLSKSIRCYRRSLVALRDGGRITSVAEAMLAVGRLYYKSQDYTRAIGCLKRSALIATHIDSRPHEAQSRTYLGASYSRMQNYRQALSNLLREYILVSSLNDDRNAKNARRNIDRMIRQLLKRNEVHAHKVTALLEIVGATATEGWPRDLFRTFSALWTDSHS